MIFAAAQLRRYAAYIICVEAVGSNRLASFKFKPLKCCQQNNKLCEISLFFPSTLCLLRDKEKS
jgi:hypothetical protein